MANRNRNRKLEEWRPVVAAWEASGVSVSTFCADRGISESWFYNRRHALEELGVGPFGATRGFERVACAPVHQAQQAEQPLSLQFGAARLELPAGVEAAWLAGLMRELSDATVS